jgi:hypothetical protein
MAFNVAGYGAGVSGAPTKIFARDDGTSFEAFSPVLRSATVVEADTGLCQQKYSDRIVKIGPGQICAGLNWDSPDSCQGDSGGPLVAMDRPTQCPLLVGIVSWGEGCGSGGRFGVYTRISQYEDWIASKTLQSVALAATVPPTLPELQRALLQQLDDALSQSRGQVKVSLSSGPTLPLKGKFVIDVESSVTGRLLLMDVDPSGKVTQIYPNASTSEKIAAREKKEIPSKGAGFDYFVASDPPGKGRLVALVVPDAFPYESLVGDRALLDKGVSAEGEVLPRIPIEERERANYLINLVHQVLSTAPASDSSSSKFKDWGYATLDYEVLKAP